MITRAKWMKRGTFDCVTGRWRGSVFDIDPDVLAQVTEYAAANGCGAMIRNDVRLDNSERRVIVTLGIAG